MAYTPLIEVNDLKLALRKGPSTRRLVDGVTFRIPKGTVLGLIGESGCGKSLTCLSILNLLPKEVVRESGEIRFQGERIDTLTDGNRRRFRGNRIAVILQNPMSAFDPVCTIRKHFKETFSAHKHIRSGCTFDRIENALREVGFSNPGSILRLYPFQMSGGMLQRVMIALALIHDAPLLIADESTTDLDVISQSRILDLLDRLRREREMGILLVTHDLSVIARMADHVAVMRGGKIVESARVDVVFRSPANPYTRALLDAHFGLYERSGGQENH